MRIAIVEPLIVCFLSGTAALLTRRAAPSISAGNSQGSTADSSGTPNVPSSTCKFGDACRHSNCNRSHPTSKKASPSSSALVLRSRVADGPGDQ